MKYSNFIQLKVQGLNQNRLISALTDNGILLHNISLMSSSVMSFFVHKNQRIKALAIINKMCYNVSVIRQTFLIRLLNLAGARLGLVIGCVIILGVLALSNALVWRVNIDGLQNVPKNAVTNILKQNKINTFIFKKNVNLGNLKSQILQIENIVDASVYLDGVTLKISVFEQLPQDDIIKPKQLITAKYDCVITSLIVYEGTAAVKVGDVVKKGTQLILPYVYNTNGEVLKEVVPSGIVYADVVFTKSAFFMLEQTEFVKTGKSKTITNISIFKYNINSLQYNEFEYYTAFTSTNTLAKNMFLPIKVTSTTYTELQKQTTTYTMQQQTDKYLASLTNDLLLQASGGAVLKTTHDVRPTLDGYRIDVFVTANTVVS